MSEQRRRARRVNGGDRRMGRTRFLSFLPVLCVLAAHGLSACTTPATGPEHGGAHSDPRLAAPNPTPASRPSSLLFEDRGPESGIAFRLALPANGDAGIRDTIGHPIALLDADVDGLLDLLLAGPDRVELYRNQGSWRFRRWETTGLRQAGYWQGVAVADVDRDGQPDLFLSGFGCAGLYLNRGGGRFQDVTRAAGLPHPNPGRWDTGAAFADMDLDGDLDLYVSAYVELGGRRGICTYPGGVRTACSPTMFPPQRGVLYENDGAGHFRDVTRQWGLDAAHGNGLGVVFGDLNADGFPELYLANDQLECDLFVNEAGKRFVPRGMESGTAFGANGGPQSGMGVDIGDYDNDGRPDLVVTNYLREPTSLYHNLGDSLFSNESVRSGLGSATVSTVGWGVKWADFDNDGWLDLAVANGHPLHRIAALDPSTTARQPFQVFRNGGDGSFQEQKSLFGQAPARNNDPSSSAPERGTTRGGLPRHAPGLSQPGNHGGLPLHGRALCVGDVDNDGMVDLIISDLDGVPLLLRNTTPSGHHRLSIRLKGSRPAEGVRVEVTVRGRTLIRSSVTAGSFFAAGDPRVHFGLGDARTTDRVLIRWPNGRIETRTQVPADQELVIHSP